MDKFSLNPAETRGPPSLMEILGVGSSLQVRDSGMRSCRKKMEKGNVSTCASIEFFLGRLQSTWHLQEVFQAGVHCVTSSSFLKLGRQALRLFSECQ